MKIGDDIPYIGNWARIHFVENEGMAFGMSFGEGMGKFLLTIFRIIAVGFISYYLVQQVKNKKASKGFIFALSLILTGAVGNIIDSIFYSSNKLNFYLLIRLNQFYEQSKRIPSI